MFAALSIPAKCRVVNIELNYDLSSKKIEHFETPEHRYTVVLLNSHYTEGAQLPSSSNKMKESLTKSNFTIFGIPREIEKASQKFLLVSLLSALSVFNQSRVYGQIGKREVTDFPLKLKL